MKEFLGLEKGLLNEAEIREEERQKLKAEILQDAITHTQSLITLINNAQTYEIAKPLISELAAWESVVARVMNHQPPKRRPMNKNWLDYNEVGDVRVIENALAKKRSTAPSPNKERE